ncbi:YidC/Oxa1 family insertase periplasmic-domain containing protein [bacterium]|nr:YidC/Oxa1 family insertase periplasmic-domain containing protein [bacterium]
MDIKRLLLALALSFVFIVTWNVFFSPVELENEVEPKEQNVEFQPQSTPQKEQDGPLVVNSVEPGVPIELSTSLVKLKMVNGATSIHNLQIVEYGSDNTYKHTGSWDYEGQEYLDNVPVELIRGAVCNPCLIIDGTGVEFNQVGLDKKNNTQTVLSVSKEDIVKETVVYDDSYTIEHKFKNLPDKNIILVWDSGLLPSEKLIKDDLSYFSVYAQNQQSYEEKFLSSVDGQDSFTFDDNVGWAGLKSKYFIKSVTNHDYNNLKAKKVIFNVNPSKVIDGAQTVNVNMEYHYGYQDLKGGSLQVNSYVGPIDMKHLNQEENKHLSQLFGFGWFFIGYLGMAVMWLLTTLYSIIPNYGVVCILFAFIIRFFTGPLTKKSFLSNQKMQAIQPKLKKIQEKYKDDTGKLNQEIMGLYQKEGVNPLGGCLPILIQMPLLIALFQVFRKTIEFRGASFLPFWITDLSQPDVIIQFEFLKNIWGVNYFFGHGIALLPIIMGVVMFLNMKMTATNNINPSQASTMYIMNGFFILLFNTFPSGLNLYYTVYNILNFLQQKKLQKINS